MADQPRIVPTHINELDKTKYLLAQSRVNHADAVMKNLTFQLAQAQDMLKGEAQKLGQLEIELRGRYSLGPTDKFDVETGKITRDSGEVDEKPKDSAGEGKSADSAESGENPRRTPETALPGVQGPDGQGRVASIPKIAKGAVSGDQKRPRKGSATP